jgi:hypothetical protein
MMELPERIHIYKEVDIGEPALYYTKVVYDTDLTVEYVRTDIVDKLRHELEQAQELNEVYLGAGQGLKERVDELRRELEQARKWARAWKRAAKRYRSAFNNFEKWYKQGLRSIKLFPRYGPWKKEESLTDEKG